MHLQITVLVLVLIFLTNSAAPQSISASYSLISGSTWNGYWVFPNFPTSHGVFTIGRTPGARNYHNVFIYNDLLYNIFGNRVTPMDDIWAFRLTTKTWAWMAGKSNDGSWSFGTQGIALASNTPGYRFNYGGALHRERGEFILYGGTDSGEPYRSDLWSFNLATNMWTWLKGRSTIGEVSVYNKLGVSTSSTTPGARSQPSCIVYPSTKEFLLFGGAASFELDHSDMWAFNFTSFRWTWISGSSGINDDAVLGQKGAWSTAFRPKSRQMPELVLNSETKILYFFGSYSTGTYMNDFWAFKRDTLEWAWISGVTTGSTAGTCGTRGRPSVNNSPGARAGHCMNYHDRSGLLIMFGGYGYSCTGAFGYMSDTWAFNPSSNEWSWIAGVSTINFRQDYSTLAAQTGTKMAIDTGTASIFYFGGYGYISQNNQGDIDYVWSGNITFSPSSRADSVNMPITSDTSNTLASSAMTLLSIQKPTYSSLLETSAISLSATAQSMMTHSSLFQTSLEISTASDLKLNTQKLSATSASSSFLTLSDLGFVTEMSRSQNVSLITYNLATTLSQSDALQNSETFFILTLPIVTRLLAVTIALVVFLISCLAYHYSRNRKQTQHSAPNDVTSSSIPEIESQMSTFTTSSHNGGSSTFANSSIGVYLPGGLQVDGTVAYRVETEIAKGGGGSVWLATVLDPALREYGGTVVVKILNVQNMNERAFALFKQEIALMNAFQKYRNIVKLVGYSENPYSIILKYYPYGSLWKWLSNETRILSQSLLFMKDISYGIAVMHANGVVHCDLKPDNILIDKGSRFFAVITDFGVSRIITDKLLKVEAYQVQRIKGVSIAYAAPEAIVELRGGKAARVPPDQIMARDIFSFGMILLTVLTGGDRKGSARFRNTIKSTNSQSMKQVSTLSRPTG